jgi:hypothetical protein
MPKRSEIEKAIADLQSQLDSADPDDEFDIEIWDGNGNGARIPYSRGKDWFEKFFGVPAGDAPKPSEGTSGGSSGGSKTGQGKTSQSQEGTQTETGPAVLRHLRQSGGQSR